MSGSWTPGPWAALPGAVWSIIVPANELHKRLGTRTEVEVAPEKFVSPIGSVYRDADTALIIAAPELAEAVTELVQAMVVYQAGQDDDAPPQHTEMMARARAALAKARGES